MKGRGVVAGDFLDSDEEIVYEACLELIICKFIE
jgi:hypothetical protein